MVNITKNGEELTDEETNEVDETIPIPTWEEEEENWEGKEALIPVCGFDVWLRIKRKVKREDVTDSSKLWSLWLEYLEYLKSHT